MAAAEGLRLRHHIVHVQILVVEVERFGIAPHLLDRGNPFLRVEVALGMFALLGAEHVEFRLVPANNDVESEASLADVIGCHHLLRRYKRVEHGRVHCAENRDVLCLREKAARPRHGLVRCALKIRRTAIALPTADRQDEIDPAFIRELRHLRTARPVRQPALGRLVDRAA